MQIDYGSITTLRYNNKSRLQNIQLQQLVPPNSQSIRSDSGNPTPPTQQLNERVTSSASPNSSKTRKKVPNEEELSLPEQLQKCVSIISGRSGTSLGKDDVK